MNYPTIVYKCPGDHHMKGGSFSYMGVANENAMKAALDEGWSKTLSEAAGERPEKTLQDGENIIEDEVDDTSAPTREEMEDKAKELKVKFNSRTSDEVLLERINEKL